MALSRKSLGGKSRKTTPPEGMETNLGSAENQDLKVKKKAS